MSAAVTFPGIHPPTGVQCPSPGTDIKPARLTTNLALFPEEVRDAQYCRHRTVTVRICVLFFVTMTCSSIPRHRGFHSGSRTFGLTKSGYRQFPISLLYRSTGLVDIGTTLCVDHPFRYLLLQLRAVLDPWQCLSASNLFLSKKA